MGEDDFNPDIVICPYCDGISPVEFAEIDSTGMFAKCLYCGEWVEGDF